MVSKKVLLPQPIEQQAVTFLEDQGCEIVLAPDPKPETVKPLMKGVHGLILRTGIQITRDLLNDAGELSIISRTGGGLDNVDLEAATEREIIVTSNLGVNTVSVVEHVLCFMLALFKQLTRMDDGVKEGNFSIRYKNYPRDVHGHTLGLLGFGRIGSTLGKICSQAFGMQVLACDPYLPDEVKGDFGDWVEFTDIRDLLSRADVVSIHVPLTEDTRYLVGERELSWMKPGAVLINTSRGGLVDESALAKALSTHKIAGAGLDVFEQEPVSPDNPLLSLDNVLVSPHSAALTQECVIRMATEAAQCVVDLFNGIAPKNIANPQLLKTETWKNLK